jgi:hypothetical protein
MQKKQCSADCCVSAAIHLDSSAARGFNHVQREVTAHFPFCDQVMYVISGTAIAKDYFEADALLLSKAGKQAA